MFSPDSIRVEWGKVYKDDMNDDERRRYVEAPDAPSLVIAGPFGKLRVFPPAGVIKALGNNLEPLLAGLASRQIDRLPWPFVEDDSGQFIQAPVLCR